MVLGGLEFPAWKSILTFALAGFVILGQDVRRDVHALEKEMSYRREIDAGAIQFREDIKERLSRIEQKQDALALTKPDVDPLQPGSDLTPLVRQINTVLENQRRQQEQIDRIYRHLSPER